MTLSTNAKIASFSQETAEVFALLLTITSSGFAQPLRFSTDNATLLPTAGVRGTLSRGEEYLYLPMNIDLPTQDETGVSKAKITLDNINREIITLLRTVQSPLTMTIEIVLASSPDTVEMSVPDMKLERVQYDAFQISGEISLDYFELEPFPSGRFVPSKWAGIF